MTPEPLEQHVRGGDGAGKRLSWPGDCRAGANVNATVSDRDSDMGSGALYHDNRVRVEKISQEMV